VGVEGAGRGRGVEGGGEVGRSSGGSGIGLAVGDLGNWFSRHVPGMSAMGNTHVAERMTP
jgi:hypothetical protein